MHWLSCVLHTRVMLTHTPRGSWSTAWPGTTPLVPTRTLSPWAGTWSWATCPAVVWRDIRISRLPNCLWMLLVLRDWEDRWAQFIVIAYLSVESASQVRLFVFKWQAFQIYIWYLNSNYQTVYCVIKISISRFNNFLYFYFRYLSHAACWLATEFCCSQRTPPASVPPPTLTLTSTWAASTNSPSL